MRRYVPWLLVLTVFAGCAGPQKVCEAGGEWPDCEPFGAGPVLGSGLLPVFATPMIIDEVRSGGEPVIAITPTGTLLVSSHPGYTHVRPTADDAATVGELVTPTQGQSYLWRSTDGGATWTHVSLLPNNPAGASGPRGAGQGVSDPDFTIDANGRIYLTDLEALASASLSWSDDDGVTWLEGNNLASEGVIDRQWLASHGATLYFTGNYLANPEGQTRPLLATEDGLNMEQRGYLPDACAGDILVDPRDGRILATCYDDDRDRFGIASSGDGGRTWRGEWSQIDIGGPILPEPAVDTNGTVYIAGHVDGARAKKLGLPEDSQGLVLAYTHDLGKTWGYVGLGQFFPDLVEGMSIWPWLSAGSPGRVSVTFLGSATPDAATEESSEWDVYNVIVLNATSQAPIAYPTKLTPRPMHRGGMCQGGTICQADTAVNKNSDRRLGDFFETTIDAEGFLHVVHADTEANPGDAVSHVSYIRMTDGPRLLEAPVPARFPTQG